MSLQLIIICPRGSKYRKISIGLRAKPWGTPQKRNSVHEALLSTVTKKPKKPADRYGESLILQYQPTA